MELHRTRTWVWVGAGMVAIGLFAVAVIVDKWGSKTLVFDWKLLVAAPGGLLVGGLLVYSDLRPFRCRIDEHGLTLRLPDDPKLARHVGWDSIEAIMLEPRTDGPPRLVLVPAADADLGIPAEYSNKVDGRPSVILVDTKDVKESPDRIRTALRHYAGSRYTYAD